MEMRKKYLTQVQIKYLTFPKIILKYNQFFIYILYIYFIYTLQNMCSVL